MLPDSQATFVKKMEPRSCKIAQSGQTTRRESDRLQLRIASASICKEHVD